jgi:hypothetical protein
VGLLARLIKSVSGVEESQSSQPGATHPLRGSAKAGLDGTKAQYIGCYRDSWNVLNPSSTSARDLDGFFGQDDNLTPARCVSVCRSRGFAFAGVQYSQIAFAAIDDPRIKGIWAQFVFVEEEVGPLWWSALTEAKAKGPAR